MLLFQRDRRPFSIICTIDLLAEFGTATLESKWAMRHIIPEGKPNSRKCARLACKSPGNLPKWVFIPSVAEGLVCEVIRVGCVAYPEKPAKVTLLWPVL